MSVGHHMSISHVIMWTHTQVLFSKQVLMGIMASIYCIGNEWLAYYLLLFSLFLYFLQSQGGPCLTLQFPIFLQVRSQSFSIFKSGIRLNNIFYMRSKTRKSFLLINCKRFITDTRQNMEYIQIVVNQPEWN